MRHVEVKVSASLDKNGRVEFDSCWHGDADPAGVWHPSPVDLPKGSGEHLVEFSVDDQTGLDLEFYSNPNSSKKKYQSVWVQVDTCPQGGNGPHHKQIREKVRKSGQSLTFKDKNDTQCDIHYNLRFKGKPGHQADNPARPCPPYEYDPIIRNRGR
jgi:hypothetical protein